MGRDSFGQVLGEGAMGTTSQTYDPGEATLSDELIQEILESHLRGTLYKMTPKCRNDIKWEAEHLESLLDASEGESEAQLLVDSLVTALQLQGDKHPNLLLSPLVQALYNRGHNNLHIDLSHFQEAPYSLAYGLRGKESEPLTLTVASPRAHDVGEYLEHCHLIFSGDCRNLGYECYNSILEHVGRVWHVGRAAKACSITTDSVLSSGSLADGAEGSDFYIRKMSQSDLQSFPGRFFFTKGNALYVLDETGEWKETRGVMAGHEERWRQEGMSR